VLFGESVAHNVYLPKEHPLYAGDENLTIYNFDPEKGKALLAEAGWTDTDGDGIIDKNGQPFHVTYGTTAGNRLREQVTQIIQAQLKKNCGISVELYYKPAREWFADGPEGPLFGRAYDLGEFAWLTGVEPPCDLYITSQIPPTRSTAGAHPTTPATPTRSTTPPASSNSARLTPTRRPSSPSRPRSSSRRTCRSCRCSCG